LISSLLSIYSAGRKISRLVGQEANSSWHIFDGGKHDLIFAPIGGPYTMLVMGQGLADEDRVMNTVNIFASARKPIDQALNTAPAAVSASQEAPTIPTETAEQPDIELEPLLKDAKKKMKPTEVNDFWVKAAGKHKAPTKPDMLTYEQAKQLGLTPEENA
jgi:hypothetical protein